MKVAEAGKWEAHEVQMFVVSLKASLKTHAHLSRHDSVECHGCSSCRCQCWSRLVGQLHHVDVVASAAQPLHAGTPAKATEIEGCDKAPELAFVVYVNMIEPFGRYCL